MKNKFKKLIAVLLLGIIFFNSCDNKKSENTTTENITSESAKTNDKKVAEKEISKDNYTEYFTCIIDGKKYTVGNNSEISSGIFTMNLGKDLSINTSNSAQTSGASQEINFRLPSFDKTTPKEYDISAASPMTIDKLNGTDLHYITTTNQPKAIHVTEIKDGFVYGNFECIATGVEDKTKTISLTNGEFKIKLN